MTALKIKRTVAVPTVLDPNTLYLVRNITTGFLEITVVGNDGASFRTVTLDDFSAWLANNPINTVGALTTARSITATGDADWTVNFDGAGNVSSALTLKDTGVIGGQYSNLVVNSKGLVTGIRALTAADIPAIPGSKINSELSVDTTGNAATSSKLQTSRFINGVLFDGSQDITINAADSTERIASNQKGVANGVAPLDSNGLVSSNFLPSYVDDVVEVTIFDELPGQPNAEDPEALPSKGKIYVVSPVEGDPEIYRWGGSSYILIPMGAGTADIAVRLAFARSISMTGDGTWSVSFDGSGNVSAVMSLADMSIAAGTYGNFQVDGKGRIVAIRALVASDIPSLSHTTVASSAGLKIVEEW